MHTPHAYSSFSLIICTSHSKIILAGEAVAPIFAIGMIFFLLLFVAYFTFAVVSLVVDFSALDAECAEVVQKPAKRYYFCLHFSQLLSSRLDSLSQQNSWVWLYVLLAIVIPTALVMLL